MEANSLIAFAGSRQIAQGAVEAVARKAKQWLDEHRDAQILVFDEHGQVVEIDFRGSVDAVLKRISEGGEAKAGPGRPKLGVVPREVTLLPRHWQWLNAQPGGASVTLRKLVDAARKDVDGKQSVRIGKERAYKFMSAMAGNEPGFEEAARALFADDLGAFVEHMQAWPHDVRQYTMKLAGNTFTENNK